MKILVTTVFFPPQNAIASQRPYVWAREWARAGHDVTVLTIQKDETKGDLSARSFDGFRVIETPPGFLISRLRKRKRQQRAELGNPVTQSQAIRPTSGQGQMAGFKTWLRSRGFLSSVRLPDVFDFWLPNACIAINAFPPGEFDLIVSTFGPPASLHAGHYAKRKNPKAKWLIDFRDLWTENHVYPGFWPFRLVENFLEWFFLREADGVTTVSRALADSLRAKTTNPVVVFENGFDPEEMASTVVSVKLPSDKVTFVYTGSLHPVHRNPETFLQALSSMSRQERQRVEVMFAGAPENFLTALIRRFGLEDTVKILGPLGRTEALRLQASSSVLLFFEKQHAQNRDGVLTGKLFEYLATGRPIWAIGIDGTSTVGRLIEENHCGKAFGLEVTKIALELQNQIRDGASPSRDVGSPRDIVHRYDRKQIASKMITWISNVPTALQKN